MKINGELGFIGKGRAGGVGDGNSGGAGAAGRLGHADDIGRFAGLRDSNGSGAVEAQVLAVNGGNRRPDRGDRQAQGQLDGIFEIGAGMIRRAAGDGSDNQRIAVAQGGCRLVQNRSALIEKVTHHVRNGVHFLAHKGLGCHAGRPPLAGASPIRSSATKS